MSSKPFRRKDLKHDEFVSVTTQVAQWLMERRRRIGWALLAVALVVSAIFGVRFAHQRQEQQAAALLAAAMEVYEAPVVPPAPDQQATPVADEAGEVATEADAAAADAGADPATNDGEAGEGPIAEPAPPAPPVTGLQFASAEEKYRAAIERFEPIIENYGSRPSGRVAAFYLGDCHQKLGDADAAAAAFTRAAEASGTLVSAMAWYRLGQLERERGDAESAIGYFDRVLSASGSLFPREEAMMAKARAQQEAGDARAALATYQRVLNDYADSYSALEARSRVEALSAELGLDPDIQGD